MPPPPDWPSARDILNLGPTEHHANDGGLNAESRRVGSVLELLTFPSNHPAHDANAALCRTNRVVGGLESCKHTTNCGLEPVRPVTGSRALAGVARATALRAHRTAVTPLPSLSRPVIRPIALRFRINHRVLPWGRALPGYMPQHGRAEDIALRVLAPAPTRPPARVGIDHIRHRSDATRRANAHPDYWARRPHTSINQATVEQSHVVL